MENLPKDFLKQMDELVSQLKSNFLELNKDKLDFQKQLLTKKIDYTKHLGFTFENNVLKKLTEYKKELEKQHQDEFLSKTEKYDEIISVDDCLYSTYDDEMYYSLNVTYKVKESQTEFDNRISYLFKCSDNSNIISNYLEINIDDENNIILVTKDLKNEVLSSYILEYTENMKNKGKILLKLKEKSNVNEKLTYLSSLIANKLLKLKEV